MAEFYAGEVGPVVIVDAGKPEARGDEASVAAAGQALVDYIREQERLNGPFNTAHGPLPVLDPETLEELVSDLEAALAPVVQPIGVEEEPEPEPQALPPRMSE